MQSSPSRPLVSVGIPTHNRPEGLRRTLECITTQTCRDLEILVSDNGSSGHATRDVVESFMAGDPRVSYHRSSTNEGPVANFRRVLERAAGKYFMWAADDDLWDERFVAAGVTCLEREPSFDAWFPSIVNIDSFDHVIRDYPSFVRFTSTGNKRRDVYRFLREPEVMGKANLIYSLYRLDKFKRQFEVFMLDDGWGSDMCFVLSFISRQDIKCDDEVLFRKRVASPDDDPDNPRRILVENPSRYIFPLSQTVPYFLGNLAAVEGGLLKLMVVMVFAVKVPLAMRNSLMQFLRL